MDTWIALSEGTTRFLFLFFLFFTLYRGQSPLNHPLGEYFGGRFLFYFLFFYGFYRGQQKSMKHHPLGDYFFLTTTSSKSKICMNFSIKTPIGDLKRSPQFLGFVCFLGMFDVILPWF